jgi:hypothetical protein
MHKLTPVLVSRVKRYECLEDVLVANERQWEKIGTTFFVRRLFVLQKTAFCLDLMGFKTC